jgi:hypothetical protein
MPEGNESAMIFMSEPHALALTAQLERINTDSDQLTNIKKSLSQIDTRLEALSQATVTPSSGVGASAPDVVDSGTHGVSAEEKAILYRCIIDDFVLTIQAYALELSKKGKTARHDYTTDRAAFAVFCKAECEKSDQEPFRAYLAARAYSVFADETRLPDLPNETDWDEAQLMAGLNVYLQSADEHMTPTRQNRKAGVADKRRNSVKANAHSRLFESFAKEVRGDLLKRTGLKKYFELNPVDAEIIQINLGVAKTFYKITPAPVSRSPKPVQVNSDVFALTCQKTDLLLKQMSLMALADGVNARMARHTQKETIAMLHFALAHSVFWGKKTRYKKAEYESLPKGVYSLKHFLWTCTEFEAMFSQDPCDLKREALTAQCQAMERVQSRFKEIAVTRQKPTFWWAGRHKDTASFFQTAAPGKSDQAMHDDLQAYCEKHGLKAGKNR